MPHGTAKKLEKKTSQETKTSQDNMHKLKTFATLIRKQLLVLEHAL